MTAAQILSHDARYCVTDPQGHKYTFETNVVGFGSARPSTFIWTFRGTSRFYVGKLNPHTMQCERTARSALPENDYSTTLLNRILARVAADDHYTYQHAGYDITDASVPPVGINLDAALPPTDRRAAIHDSHPINARPRLTVAELRATAPVAVEPEPDEEDCCVNGTCEQPATDAVSLATTTHNETSMWKVPGAAMPRNGFFSVATDGAERRVENMQAMADQLSGDLWSLEYDIPEAKVTDCPNPSGWLWAYACRKTLSCWILTDKGLSAPAVQEALELWKANHITVDLIRYHPADQAKVRDRIRQRLAEHIQAIHASLIDRIASAAERLNGVEKVLNQIGLNTGLQDAELATLTGEDAAIVKAARKIWNDCGPKGSHALTQAQRTRDNAVRSLLKSIGEDLDHAIECAKQFDETESTKSLFDAARSALAAEKATFNGDMRIRGGKLAR